MRKSWVVPALIVVFAVIVSYFMDSGDGVPFSSSSTGERGVSLFQDTLRQMGYTSRTSFRPLNQNTDTSHIYVIVQPRQPHVTEEMARDMLMWVHNGGRLIYLCNTYPFTAIDRVINTQARDIGGFFLYRYGNGEIITGNATALTNSILMENSLNGQLLSSLLTQWSGVRSGDIYFAEYYHGFHVAETFVGRLPLIIRLVMAQILIVSIIALIHLGKRFGNPVPFYEETEREENEYIRALARLYMESDR